MRRFTGPVPSWAGAFLQVFALGCALFSGSGDEHGVSGKNERLFKASSSGFGFESLPESAVASVRLAGACEFGATANQAGPKRIANKSSHPTRGSGEFVFVFHSIISLPQSDALSVRPVIFRECCIPLPVCFQHEFVGQRRIDSVADHGADRFVHFSASPPCVDIVETYPQPVAERRLGQNKSSLGTARRRFFRGGFGRCW